MHSFGLSILPLTMAIFFAVVFPASGVNYYVSGTGNDSFDGLADSSGADNAGPLRTIQKAADLVLPGDTVFIMNGTYTNSADRDLVVLRRSGTAEAWITFIKYPTHSPQIAFNGWGGFKSQSACFIEINGLTITGNRDNIDLTYAREHKGIAATSGNGIEFDGRNQTNRPHHIRIINNTVAKCCGGGISMIQCDYVTIENNIVWGNAWYSQWANSGVSLYQSWHSDSETGYKNFVLRNTCYDNRSLVEWVATGGLSDGNGIIIDDQKNTQNNSLLGVYGGRTLVANNVSFNNGGSGIHAFSSVHVDIVNNTACFNAQVVDYGCLFAGSSTDVTIANNIVIASPGKRVNASNNNSTVSYASNIWFGGEAPVVQGEGDLRTDPLLVNASTDPVVADFRLRPASPAIDAGVAQGAPGVDRDNQPRPQGDGIDRGAYEYRTPTRVKPAASRSQERILSGTTSGRSVNLTGRAFPPASAERAPRGLVRVDGTTGVDFPLPR